jgi:hypothetical protein
MSGNAVAVEVEEEEEVEIGCGTRLSWALTTLGRLHFLFRLASSRSNVSTFREPAVLSAQRYTEGLSMVRRLIQCAGDDRWQRCTHGIYG